MLRPEGFQILEAIFLMNFDIQIRQTGSVGNALRGVPRRRERVQQVRNGTEAVPYRTVAIQLPDSNVKTH
jgi:hypothetical protein